MTAIVVAVLASAAFAAGWITCWLQRRHQLAQLRTRVDAAETETARLHDQLRHAVDRRRGWQVARVTEHAIGAGRAA